MDGRELDLVRGSALGRSRFARVLAAIRKKQIADPAKRSGAHRVRWACLGRKTRNDWLRAVGRAGVEVGELDPQRSRRWAGTNYD